MRELYHAKICLQCQFSDKHATGLSYKQRHTCFIPIKVLLPQAFAENEMAAHSANIDVLLVVNDDTSDSAPCCPHGMCVWGGGIGYSNT